MHVDSLDKPRMNINECECVILDVNVYCTVYGEPKSQPTEVWAFTCTIFAIFNTHLFENSVPHTDEVLSQIVDNGTASKRLQQKWELGGGGGFKEWERRKKVEIKSKQKNNCKKSFGPLPELNPTPQTRDPKEQKDSHHNLSGAERVRCYRKFRLVEIYSHSHLSLSGGTCIRTSGQGMENSSYSSA